MARGLQNLPRINPPDTDFPNGSIKDDTGANDGTPVNAYVYNDIHQFFAKLMREAGITPNGQPDSDYIDYQYFQALRRCLYKCYTARISQSGTNPPSGVIMGYNDIGTIVWTRTGPGDYLGTLAGAFPTGLTVCIVSGVTAGGSAILVQTTVNTVRLLVYSGPSTPDDNILNGMIEIRVYGRQDGSF